MADTQATPAANTLKYEVRAAFLAKPATIQYHRDGMRHWLAVSIDGLLTENIEVTQNQNETRSEAYKTLLKRAKIKIEEVGLSKKTFGLLLPQVYAYESKASA